MHFGVDNLSNEAAKFLWGIFGTFVGVVLQFLQTDLPLTIIPWGLWVVLFFVLIIGGGMAVAMRSPNATNAIYIGLTWPLLAPKVIPDIFIKVPEAALTLSQ